MISVSIQWLLSAITGLYQRSRIIKNNNNGNKYYLPIIYTWQCFHITTNSIKNVIIAFSIFQIIRSPIKMTRPSLVRSLVKMTRCSKSKTYSNLRSTKFETCILGIDFTTKLSSVYKMLHYIACPHTLTRILHLL